MQSINEIKLKWIYSLRWIAILLQLIVLPFAVKFNYLHLDDLYKYLLVVFILFLSNLGFIWKSFPRIYNSISFQTAFDISIFTCLIILTGKMENPFWPLIYLHASMGAFLIEPKKDYQFLPFLFGSIAIVHALSIQYYSSIIFIIIPQWIILVAVWFLTRNIGLLVFRQQGTIQRLNEKNLKNQKLKTLNLLSSGILHEIGTPLNTIRLKTNRLKIKGGNAFSERDIEVLDISLLSIESVISELNKLYFENSPNSFESINIKNVLEEFFLEQKNGTQINYSINQVDSISEINFSKLTLTLVLKVILNNSLEAGATELNIQLKEDKSSYTILIKDNGPGFDSFILENFMAPYTSTKGSGRGIGLFNANLTLEALGASLEIFNDQGANTLIKLEKDEQK